MKMSTKNLAIMLVSATMLLMIALIALAIAVVIYAQANEPTDETIENADWRVLIYDNTQLIALTEDGFGQSISLPPEAHNLQDYQSMLVSPDGRYFVFQHALEENDGNALSELWIADLQTGTCCVVAENPLPFEPDTLIAGVFSPDSTHFIYSFSRIYHQVQPSSPEDMMSLAPIIDVATGKITGMLPPTQTTAVRVNSWDNDGRILFFPTCTACGGEISGYYHSWDTRTQTLTNNVEYFSVLGDTLPATGETLRLIRDEDYPLAPEFGMIPPANTIHYYPVSVEGEGTLIYHDPSDLTLGNLYWVMNGEAYVIYDWDGGVHKLVFRDGRVIDLSFGPNERVITGTPEGWITNDVDRQALHHYQMVDGQLMADSITFSLEAARVVLKPQLGDATAPAMQMAAP